LILSYNRTYGDTFKSLGELTPSCYINADVLLFGVLSMAKGDAYFLDIIFLDGISS
jgi:hypothetical protein